MRNFPSASETTTRTRLLSALAALLLCSGLAQAQEPNEGGDADTRRPPSINVEPFDNLALRGRQLVEQGKLGPDTVFEVTATAEREADGRLRSDSVRVNWNIAADEAVTALARQALTAFSESKVLAFLDGMTAVRLGLKLDRQNVSFRMECELPAESEAEKYAQAYGLLLRTMTVSRSGSGTDEVELYKRLGFSSEGKTFKMSFEMPRAEAARMIAAMLERRAAKTAARQD